MAKQNEVESPHRGGTFGCKLGGMNPSLCDSVQEQRFPPGSDQSPGWASEHPQDVGALNTEVNARNHENTQTPTTKIRPLRESGWLDVEEIWSFRDLLWSLAARDLKLRYRQTALGVLWVVFQPLAGAGIFTVVFGWVAGLKSGKLSYFLFSLAGLLGLFYFFRQGQEFTLECSTLKGACLGKALALLTNIRIGCKSLP